jgi:hypothetical protein
MKTETLYFITLMDGDNEYAYDCCVESEYRSYLLAAREQSSVYEVDSATSQAEALDALHDMLTYYSRKGVACTVVDKEIDLS